jgi:hypothetical protein
MQFSRGFASCYTNGSRGSGRSASGDATTATRSRCHDAYPSRPQRHDAERSGGSDSDDDAVPARRVRQAQLHVEVLNHALSDIAARRYFRIGVPPRTHRPRSYRTLPLLLKSPILCDALADVGFSHMWFDDVRNGVLSTKVPCVSNSRSHRHSFPLVFDAV